MKNIIVTTIYDSPEFLKDDIIYWQISAADGSLELKFVNGKSITFSARVWNSVSEDGD